MNFPFRPGEYLGKAIKGVVWYRILVDGKLWHTPAGTRFRWDAAKVVAEHLMEQLPHADIEIVGIIPKGRKS